MEVVWIDRDGDDNIKAVYANKQHEGQESIDKDDAEVVAFLSARGNTPRT